MFCKPSNGSATWLICDGANVAEDRAHDPDLIDALEAMAPRSFDGHVWRVSWARRDPLAVGTGGGRWHPADDFAALYTSEERDGVLAEIYHHLSKAPVFSSSHARLNRLRARTERTLVFDDVAALESVGVDAAAFHKGENVRTREVGAAARFLDMDGLIVPSARWPCANLVLFLDRLANLETLSVVEQRDVNWPAAWWNNAT